MAECGLLDPFRCATIPLADWLSAGLRWMVDEWRPFFQAIKFPVDKMLQWFVALLGAAPPTLIVILITLFA